MWRIYGPVIAVAVLGFVVALFLMDPAPPRTIRFGAGAPDGAYHAYAERYQRLLAEQGVEIELVDTAGTRFGSDDLAGAWHLLFFGFASCPDVCPLTLATLHEASTQLGELPSDQQPRGVMISVDPGRDDPARLTAYVQHFDPGFIGVSGTRKQLDGLASHLGVPVLIGQPDDGGYYSVDHGASLFLVDPRGQLRAILSSPHEPAGIAESVRAVLEFVAETADPA
jgi:protein SCO1/2